MFCESKKYGIEEVFALIGEDHLMGRSDNNHPHDVVVDGFKVHPQSLRYKTFFQKGTKCVCCGRDGTYFKLCADGNADPQTTSRRHFNLYSDDDVLMTKDHIVPKSRGGADKVDNMQTMCVECNVKKGNKGDGEKIRYIVAYNLEGKETVRFRDTKAMMTYFCNQYGQLKTRKASQRGEWVKQCATVCSRVMDAYINGTEVYGMILKEEMR